MTADNRSLKFSSDPKNRFWWHHNPETNYIPPIYSFLNEQEWGVMDDWFTKTDEDYGVGTGECAVPPMSFLQGILMGNGISRVLQLGHYIGYSSLLMGFMLRHMGKENALFSVDIDPSATKYTQNWIDKANLNSVVHLEVNDSSSIGLVDKVADYFDGQQPQVIFIDSSHQYQHTFEELDLWYEALQPGGFIFLHDSSHFAEKFDTTGKGGVRTALKEWCDQNNKPFFALNDFVVKEPPVHLSYRDGCGLGLVQKPILK